MADPIKEEFPGNSHTSKVLAVPEEERVPRTPIVSGKVVKKRKSLGNTITQTLFGNDARSVMNYVLHDVLIPAAKTTIQEMVSGGIEMLLFGESTGRNRSSRRDGKTYVSYGSMYKSRDSKPERTSSSVTFRSLSRDKYEDVILEDRGEAEDVIEALVDLIEQYGVATLADFYELVGIAGDFADNKYGWRNLSTARVVRVREGYSIEFPKARALD